MEVKKIVEKVVETGTVHAAYIRVRVGPGEGLLCNDRVHLHQFRNKGVEHLLASLKKYSLNYLVVN